MYPHPLPYHPNPGEVLRCDYGGLVPPEMNKIRFVVVISPRLRHRKDLCTVVPLSITAPEFPQPFHVKLDKDPYPKSALGTEVWAKCDMLMTVSFARLNAYWDGRHPNGKRNYITLRVSQAEFRAIRIGVLYAIGLGGLKDAL
jgi:mRNA interferase MazF